MAQDDTQHSTGSADASADAEAASEKRSTPAWQRAIRYVLYGIGGLLGLVLLLVVIGLFVVRTHWGQEKVKNLALTRINALFDGAALQVGELGGNIATGLKLYDVNLVKDDGERLAHIDTLTADYRLLPLLQNRLRLTNIYLGSPQVWMEQQADATWDLFNIIATDSAAVDTVTSQKTALVIELDYLDLRQGSVEAAFYAPGRDSVFQVQNLAVELGNMRFGQSLTVRLDTVTAQFVPPGAGSSPVDVGLGGTLDEGNLTLNGLHLMSARSLVRGQGTLAWPSEANDQGRDLDFTLEARPLAFRDISPFVPVLDPDGTVELTMQVQGGQERIDANLDARFSDGATMDLAGAFSPPGQQPASYQASGQIRGLNPAFFTGDPSQDGLVNADLDVDLQGPTAEQVDGHANFTVFDTRYGEYAPDRTTLESTFTDGQGQIDLRSGLRGMTLALGGTVRPFDPVPQYDLDGQFARLDIGRFTEGGTQSSNLAAAFSLEGRGIDPQTADLTARLDLAPSRINAYTIRDGYLAAQLQGGTLDFDTRMLLPEGRLAASGDAHFGEQISYRISRGEVRHLDVAALSGDTTRSAVNATFRLRGRGMDPQAMALDAHLDLADSYYGVYTLDSAELRAGLRSGQLNLNGVADLGAGGSLDLVASARPFVPVMTFEVTRMRFQHIDVGAITQNPDQQSDLNGTLALRGYGTDPQAMTLNARLDLAPSRFNDQEINTARLIAGLQRGTLTFDTGLDFPEGRLTMVGSARPFAETPAYAVREGAFTALNLGALAGNPALATSLNGTLTLEGVGTDPKTMTLDALLRFDRSTVRETVVQEGHVAADVAAGQARLTSRMNLEDGLVQLDAAGTFLGEEPSYQASGTVQNLNLIQRADSLATRFSMGFDIAGEGTDPETMQLRGHVYARQAAYNDVQIDTLGTRFDLARGLLQVDSLLLRSNVAEARAGGQIALFDSTGAHTSDFRLDADITSLQPLRGLVNADVFSLRNGTIQASIQGPSDQLRVDATAQINSLAYNNLRLAGWETQVAGTLGPDRSITQGSVQTDLNYFSTPTATIRLTQADVSYDGDEATFSIETGVDERRDMRFSGRIDPRPENQRVLIEDLGMRFDEDRWTLAQPATITYGEAYRVSNLSLSAGDQQIVIDGVIDPDSTQDFHVLIEGLRLGGFADLIGVANLGGTLDTQLDLTGPAAEPLLVGRIALDVRHRETPLGDLRIDLDYGAQRLNLDALLTHRAGSTLTLDGYVPMNLSLAPAEPAAPEAEEGVQVQTAEASGMADLRIRSDGFDLNFFHPFLNPETVSSLQGRLSADIQIGGAMNSPALGGTFGLADGQVGLEALGMTYRDIEVRGAMQDNAVVLEQATLHGGDGTLTATGRVEMPELTLGQYEIDLALDDFRAIGTEQYQATVSGDLDVSGTTEAPIISGDVQLHNTDIYLAGTGGGDIRQVELTDEDVRMLEEFFGYRVSRRDTTVSDVYNALTLAMTVEMERDTWIRQEANPEIAIELTGRLDIQKEPNEELQLFRSIEVIPQRSFIRQFGKRFDIERGTITFNGPVTELIMDIGAEYEVRSRFNPGQPEAVIILDLSGRLDDLNFALSSDPPMENTDIVSYIATGRPAGEALGGSGGDSGGLLSTGGDLAASQLASVVENIAGEELGLDVIEIRQDGLRGTQLVAGKYVAPKVYVGINQPIALSSTDNATSASQATEVTLEYEMFEWLLLQMLSGTSTSSLRLNLMGKHAFN